MFNLIILQPQTQEIIIHKIYMKLPSQFGTRNEAQNLPSSQTTRMRRCEKNLLFPAQEKQAKVKKTYKKKNKIEQLQ